MSLPEGFEFSKSSLQDYLDCSRRFWLRYIERRSWPALVTQPAIDHEQRIQAGQAFHTLVQQYLCGIPPAVLEGLIHQDDLDRWWRGLMENMPVEVSGNRFVEFMLATSLANNRLVAKYDVVAIGADRQVTILDWKTGKRKPSRNRLAMQAQTRVYPYVLCKAGKRLTGGKPIAAENIHMVYWFAEAPADPEIFHYDDALYAKDEAFLSRTIQEISGSASLDDFPTTERVQNCEPCVYRSYCLRGKVAPQLISLEDDLPEEEQTALSYADVEEYPF